MNTYKLSSPNILFKMSEMVKLPFGLDVLERIKKLEGVESIAVHGSYVYGELDEYSDIDLVATCSEVPLVESREEVLREVVDKINEDFDVPERYLEDTDYIEVDDDHMGVDYVEMEYLESLVSKLNEKGELPKDEIEDVIKFLYYSRVIYDPKDKLSELKERVPESDPSLVKYFLYGLEKINLDKEWPRWSLEAALSRDNYFQASKIFNRALESYLLALYTVNGEYYGGPKNAAFTIERLERKPEDCWEKLQQIARMGNSEEEVREKVKIFQGLREELLEIIEEENILRGMENE